MELTHSFTVPTSVDDAWALFMDLERVGGCFPGATVTEVTDDNFSGTVKVKLGPIALVYTGSGSFVERDDAAHRAVIEAKGKDKRGNGTAGATVTIQLTGGRRRGTRADVVTDLAVTGKPAQFGRGVMQDVSDKLLQAVRRLHREAADGTCGRSGAGGAGGRGPGRRGGHVGRGRLDRLRRDGLRRARRGHRRAEARHSGTRQRTRLIRRAGSRPTSRRTHRSTSARPSCRCSSSATPAMRSPPPSGSSSVGSSAAAAAAAADRPRTLNRKSNPSPSEERTDCSFDWLLVSLRRDSATLEPCHA